MIKIRTKLLIYFVAVLILVIVMFFVREQNAARIIELHNESTEQYLLLNELTSKTDQTFQSLQIYVHEPIKENLIYYQEDKQQLLDLQQEYDQLTSKGIEKKNYLNVLTSFLKYSDQTVRGVDENDVEQYSFSLNEADNTADYIHEKTLELLNEELTSYQQFITLEDKRIAYTKNMGTAVFVSIIIVSVFFAVWFSDGITRTISNLTNAAKEISAGNYQGKDVEVPTKDELSILTETFNEMKRNISESVTEVKEKARLAQLLKEMELRSLQNQINPHFLFNTLNTISKTAYIEGAERTSDLISSISSLLRYNIGNMERDTTIKDEVEIVKEYFFIQESRFGDRVTFRLNVEEGCVNKSIPCLTLQPIVENAFVHGIEGMADGATIELHIYQYDQQVCIDIKDNGAGMDQTAINRIFNSDESDEKIAESRSGHSTGIGLRNVIDRLKLFDKNSEMSIKSERGKGTVVQIRLT
ncbi:Sensor histidine kinase YesM [Gracilibacillus ureilyticus]|uniref:histidine kinase n=1 Tax=Gracilibacillus ureilyticus TaxID=531814 RepID=A0A1H9ND32_9BACI|nr:histidine kinase [Gracilibacillus ureilyticus]SER33842.1 Sensor histidine kinase YesM [Gracilibacillus ureilyticus]